MAILAAMESGRKLRKIPECLRRIPSPPHKLYVRGSDLEMLLSRPRLAVVGSRSVTTYGRQVTAELVGRLAEQGIVIISGLALGVDAVAHRAALEAGGLTIAVLPGGVDRPYPATNRRLSEHIVESSGALVSEYPPEAINFKQNFVARNRLVAGLSQAVLITEAAEKSGSLHTARFALEQGKEVLAVPGQITARTSVGANNLLKAGAHLVTDYRDVLHVLGLQAHRTKAAAVRGRNAHEQQLLDLLLQGINDGDQLLIRSGLSASEFGQTLTMLELGGKIRALGANQWGIV